MSISTRGMLSTSTGGRLTQITGRSAGENSNSRRSGQRTPPASPTGSASFTDLANLANFHQNSMKVLAELYQEKVLPLELDFFSDRFLGVTCMAPSDFRAKPMILIMGGYSSGKTTFINHILQRGYPGFKIGMEPTTDKFTCIMTGKVDQILPGHSAISNPVLPFSQINQTSCNFADHFEVVQCSDVPLLEGVTLIDTPGTLSRCNASSRNYDFSTISQWFCNRSDMIILMFDSRSLDITDELQSIISAAMKGNHRKTRILLNRASELSLDDLLRLFGTLMWTLGKVIKAAEPVRVYIGDFGSSEVREDVIPELSHIFIRDFTELFDDICQLPKTIALRQVNDMTQRAKALRVHVLAMNCIRNELGWRRSSTKLKKIVAGISDILGLIRNQYEIPLSDLPDPEEFKERFAANWNFDFSLLPKDKKGSLLTEKLNNLHHFMTRDLPKLTNVLPMEYELCAHRDQIKRRADNRADEEEKRMSERRDRNPHTERYQVETPKLNGYLRDPEENHDPNHPYNLFADVPDRLHDRYSRMTNMRSSPVTSSARSDDEIRADREDMSMM